MDLHPCADDADDPCPHCGGTGHARSPSGHGGHPGLPEEAELIRAVADAIRAGKINPNKLLPTTTLYVHLSAHALWHTLHPHPAADPGADPGGGDGDGEEPCPHCAAGEPVPAAARVEGRIGPVLLDQARTWLGHRRVTLKPVVDLNTNHAVDGCQVPAWMAEARHLAQPGSAFPHSPNTSRRKDSDHTREFARNADGSPAQPGQTRLDNLGGLERRLHRAKTHKKGWRVYQPTRGVYLWRSPHGHWYRVDNTGTHRLGKHPQLTNQHNHPDDGAPTRPEPRAPAHGTGRTTEPLEGGVARAAFVAFAGLAEPDLPGMGTPDVLDSASAEGSCFDSSGHLCGAAARGRGGANGAVSPPVTRLLRGGGPGVSGVVPGERVG